MVQISGVTRARRVGISAHALRADYLPRRRGRLIRFCLTTVKSTAGQFTGPVSTRFSFDPPSPFHVYSWLPSPSQPSPTLPASRRVCTRRHTLRTPRQSRPPRHRPRPVRYRRPPRQPSPPPPAAVTVRMTVRGTRPEYRNVGTSAAVVRGREGEDLFAESATRSDPATGRPAPIAARTSANLMIRNPIWSPPIARPPSPPPAVVRPRNPVHTPKSELTELPRSASENRARTCRAGAIRVHVSKRNALTDRPLPPDPRQNGGYG